MAKRMKRFRRRRFSPRARYRRFRRGKAPIPLLIAAPAMIKGLAEPIWGDNAGRTGAWNMIKAGANPKDALMEAANIASMNFTGYDFKANRLDFNYAVPTYTWLLAGWFGHKLANWSGANRYMKKIPMIGKYIQL